MKLKKIYALGAAFAVLATIGVIWINKDSSPITLMAEELKSADAETRYHAAKDLEDLGPEAAPAIEALAVALGDDVVKVRYRAAKALSKIGPSAKSAVPALIQALDDPERDVRYYSAKALYRIEEDAADALDPVIKKLEQREPDADVRRYLLKTLGEIGQRNKDAYRVIKRFARDEDSQVRAEVAEILSEFNSSWS